MDRQTGLAQRNGEIVVLTVMVNDMLCPEHIDAVACTVPPVVQKVDADDGDQPLRQVGRSGNTAAAFHTMV